MNDLRRRSVLMVLSAVLLAAPACGSSESADAGDDAVQSALVTDDADQPVVEDEAAPSDDETETATGDESNPNDTELSPDDDQPPAASSQDCVVGTWILDSDAFVDSIAEAFATDIDGAGSIGFDGGTMTVVLDADGSWTSVRDDWTMKAEVDGLGTAYFTIDGEDSGTYAVAGDSITLDTLASQTEVTTTVEVDGQQMSLPMGGTRQVDVDPLGGAGVVNCEGDAMTVSVNEGDASATSTFVRQ